MAKRLLEENDLRGRIKSDFPKHTLEEALVVPKAIEDTNGGRPLPPTDVAIALGVSPGGSDFRIKLSSSLKYGATSGSYKQEKIFLTDLGRRIVSPISAEDQHEAMLGAALTPETFRRMYEYFRGKKLPDPAFFQNTVVREFEVPREHAARCIQIFVINMEKVGLVRVASTGKWLASEPLPPGLATQRSAGETGDEPLDSEPSGNGNEVDLTLGAPVPAKPSGDSPLVKNAIFIGHGKNKKPLEQLKQILDHYHIPYRVAVDEANQFKPISDKVGDTMKECGAAILIFTADEQFKDMHDRIVWRPSENVVHELGAASILYGGRIIIFKEDSVVLPTNFSGIGYISFPKDELASKVHDLFRELVAFQLIKITIGG